MPDDAPPCSYPVNLKLSARTKYLAVKGCTVFVVDEAFAFGFLLEEVPFWACAASVVEEEDTTIPP